MKEEERKFKMKFDQTTRSRRLPLQLGSHTFKDRVRSMRRRVFGGRRTKRSLGNRVPWGREKGHVASKDVRFRCAQVLLCAQGK